MWIDHSTTDHEQNKVFTEALTKIGGSLLEAPITGGLEALKKGQMAVWVAGDKVIPYQFRQYRQLFRPSIWTRSQSLMLATAQYSTLVDWAPP